MLAALLSSVAAALVISYVLGGLRPRHLVPNGRGGIRDRHNPDAIGRKRAGPADRPIRGAAHDARPHPNTPRRAQHPRAITKPSSTTQLPQASWILSLADFPRADQAEAFIVKAEQAGHPELSMIWSPDWLSLSGRPYFAVCEGRIP